MKKKILITGANGYIGRHVVKAFAEYDCDVYACDLKFEGLDRRAHCISENIFNGEEDIYEKLGKPDVCVHLAWRNGFIHNDDSHIVDLPRHYLFLRNMMKGGLPQLVVMGTMHEVGYWEGAINEKTPTNPLSLYAIAKNSLRQMVELDAKKYGTVLQWTRGFYIIGDDLRSNSIFSKIVKTAKEGKKTFPFTSGKNLYDFIKIDELANQIRAVAMQNEVTGIINCCSGEPISLAEQVEMFIAEHGYNIRLEYGAYPERKYDSPGIWGDSTKIQLIMQNDKKNE